MKISELIKMLENEKGIHGDIDVHIQATEIDEDGSVVAGGGYYGSPYEIRLLKSINDMAVCFDKVVFCDDD